MHSVDAALRRYFADELLDVDNQWKCPKCECAVQARKSFRLQTAPNILIVTLKRFMLGRYGKISRKIAYTQNLDLSQFLLEDSPDTAPATYSLFGVLVHISHSNSTTFGHCVSYVRNEDGAWFLCDDSTTRQVNEEQAMNQTAYVLFYIRDVPRTGPSTLCPCYESPGTETEASGFCSAHSDEVEPSIDALLVESGVASSQGTLSAAPSEGGLPLPTYCTWSRDDLSRWRIRVHLPGCCASNVKATVQHETLELSAHGWATLVIPLLPGFSYPSTCKFFTRSQNLALLFVREGSRIADDESGALSSLD